eukprot:COSAG04_NODE_11_length_42922_cov_38.819700_10_plen_190_part_00
MRVEKHSQLQAFSDLQQRVSSAVAQGQRQQQEVEEAAESARNAELRLQLQQAELTTQSYSEMHSQLQAARAEVQRLSAENGQLRQLADDAVAQGRARVRKETADISQLQVRVSWLVAAGLMLMHRCAFVAPGTAGPDGGVDAPQPAGLGGRGAERAWLRALAPRRGDGTRWSACCRPATPQAALARFSS